MDTLSFFYSAKFNFISYKHAKSCSKKLTNFYSHAHSGHEVLYIIEGTPSFGFEENSLALKAGDVIIIPPQQYHFLQVAPNDHYERISLLLFPKQLNLDVTLDKVMLLSDKHKPLQRLLKDFSYYYKHCDEQLREEIFLIKTQELIFTLNHLLPSDDVLLHSTADGTMRTILQYVNANIKKNITVADISKH